MAGGDEGRCPACGAPREASALRCPFCGWKFENDEAALREEYTPDLGPASTGVEIIPSGPEIQPQSSESEAQEVFQAFAQEAPKVAQTAQRVWLWVVIGIVAILAVSCVCCTALGYILLVARSSH